MNLSNQIKPKIHIKEVTLAKTFAQKTFLEVEINERLRRDKQITEEARELVQSLPTAFEVHSLEDVMLSKALSGDEIATQNWLAARSKI